MKWQTYCNNFKAEADKLNISEVDISKYLQYAKLLYEKDLPIIYDQYHLSLLVGYQYEYILGASNSSKDFYRKFNIPKKNGGVRNICEPLPSLKEIQHWILKEILYKLDVSKFAKAYVKGRSIKENARFHRNQKIVVTLDIRDFFPSIKIFKVIDIFKNIGYNDAVAVMLANLCCLKQSLPQGAPTSAALSNLVMMEVDKQVAVYTECHKIRYTRYADDLTFSGDFEINELISHVKLILKSNGFRVNNKKTRKLYNYRRQIVTGIVTNKKLQVSKKVRKDLRQQMYYIQRFGLNSHLERTKNKKKNYLEHLLGITNFILFINPKDNEVKKYNELLKEYVSIKNLKT
ncbi:retron St85 family RNA-directed DNA polymerase [Clostridium intestinale]|uniref:retron St85 family RNA-directed DNA polymerase n=1 Tax=Clostridium intestinale TaxID=36845 RepID=UPI0028F0B6A1|nr:retron St85 family RNA-directed DNA polymerase [Clostridium intestinale]